MLKEYFEQYIKVSKSKSSVGHYITGINTINTLLKKYDFPIKNLFDVHTAEELDDIRNFIYTNEEFINKNKIGHQMYSVAFNHFFRFACEDAIRTKEEIIKLDIVIPKPQLVRQAESSKWRRNQIIVSQVIKSVNYLCEYNSDHKTFTSEITQNNYVEGHHLIPLQTQDKFYNNLDVYANIVSLCPVCHRLLHHGIYSEKVYVLEKIYDERSDRLKNSGIKIGIRDLLQIVG
jgi:5-methylcytosine-specific restriction protein A